MYLNQHPNLYWGRIACYFTDNVPHRCPCKAEFIAALLKLKNKGQKQSYYLSVLELFKFDTTVKLCNHLVYQPVLISHQVETLWVCV